MKTLLRVMVSCIVLSASAGAHFVTLRWDLMPWPNPTTYTLYCGTNSGSYQWSTNVGNCDVVTLTNFNAGKYFFVVTVRDAVSGLESDPSNEVNVCLDCKPAPITNLTVQLVP